MLERGCKRASPRAALRPRLQRAPECHAMTAYAFEGHTHAVIATTAVIVGLGLLRVGWLLWRERAVVAFANVTGDET